jgi:hypothetical protein
MDAYMYMPLHTSLHAMRIMTPDQGAALIRLAYDYPETNSIGVQGEPFGLPQGWLGFSLWRGADFAFGHILTGGISPEGEVST